MESIRPASLSTLQSSSESPSVVRRQNLRSHRPSAVVNSIIASSSGRVRSHTSHEDKPRQNAQNVSMHDDIDSKSQSFAPNRTQQRPITVASALFADNDHDADRSSSTSRQSFHNMRFQSSPKQIAGSRSDEEKQTSSSSLPSSLPTTSPSTPPHTSTFQDARGPPSQEAHEDAIPTRFKHRDGGVDSVFDDEEMMSQQQNRHSTDTAATDGFSECAAVRCERAISGASPQLIQSTTKPSKDEANAQSQSTGSSSPSLVASFKKLFSPKGLTSPQQSTPCASSPSFANQINTPIKDHTHQHESAVENASENAPTWEPEKDILLVELNRNMQSQASLMSENDQLKRELAEMRSIIETNQKNWQKLFNKQKLHIDQVSNKNLSLEQSVSGLTAENKRLATETEALKDQLNHMLQNEARLLDQNISLFQLNEKLIEEKLMVEKKLHEHLLEHSIERDAILADREGLLDAFNKLLRQQAHNDLHRDILDKVRTNTLNPVTLVENIKQSPHFRYLFYSLRDYKQKVALLDECIKISTTTCDQNLLEYCTVFMERTLTREEFIGPMRTRPAMYKCYENYLRSSGKKEDLRRLYIDLDDLDGEFRLLLEDVFASRDVS
eukprot:TRINITY_DN3913_c0_g1_i1.p1 TRINITY_DN3913_c0_g1~~TRINITY_DN3913_c0_g1_i1.p1  ORF type:complete len:611 (+),score=139.08 TRINITY_DN3913_c0_g1_i1:51-1883(+)